MEKPFRQKSLSIENAMARLHESAQVINRREGVKTSELKRVREAFTILAKSDAGERDIYEEFLCKVFKNAGPQMVTLCAVGLGRTIVKAMKDRIRVDLPFEIKDQATNLESNIIQSIVDNYMQTGPTQTGSIQTGLIQTGLIQTGPTQTGSIQTGSIQTGSIQTGPIQTELIQTGPTQTDAASDMENVSIADIQKHHPTLRNRAISIQHPEFEKSSSQEEQDQEQMMVTGSLTGYVYELTIEDARAVTLSDQVNGKIWLTYPYNSSSMPFLTIPIAPEFARQYMEERPQIM